jgi:two-component system, cell cycle sensor histidine kinase and response regulator CckA
MICSENVKILLVEDTADHAMLISESFIDCGCGSNLTVAENLAQAREIIQNSPPDLLITDYMLPDGEGLELLPGKDSEQAAFPIIVMTSHGDEHLAVEAMRTGALDYIVKTDQTLLDMPRIARSALREWGHIVEKWEAQKALLASEKKLESIIQAVPDIIYRLDCSGKIAYVNNSVKQYGYNPDELIGKELLELVHPDDREKANYRLNERRTGERKTVSLEIRLFPKSNENRIFEVYSDSLEECDYPVLRIDAEGVYEDVETTSKMFIGTQGIARDITERKQLEKASQESERKFRELYEGSRDGIVFMGEDREIIDSNETFQKMVGYSHDELQNVTAWDLTPKKWHEWESTEIIENQLKNRGYSETYQKEYIHKSGRIIPVEITTYRFEDLAEGDICYWGAVRDISDRLQAEKTLRESEERYRALTEHSMDIVMRFDSNCRHLFVNTAVSLMTGIPAEEFIGKTHREMGFPEERCDFWEEKIQNVFQTAEPLQVEFELEVKRGKINVDWRLTPEFSENGFVNTVLTSARDITLQTKLHEQLRQSQKMETVGLLAGGVAHDFNNMLTPILGYSDMALIQLGKNDKLFEEVNSIREAAEKAASLTNQLLAFSRKQVLNLKVRNLNGVVSDFSKMLSRLIGEDIELCLKLDPLLLNAKVDIDQVQQILMNLAVNSRDAMSQGGVLTIETSNVQFEEGYYKEAFSVEPGSYCLITVTDNGCGMDAYTKNRIFEPFFTSKERGKGTGLGLSTVYGIVKQHNGYIWTYSERGKGTVFKVYFPQYNEEAEPVEIKPQNVKIDGNGKLVLLVEDEKMVRNLTRDVLISNGFEVLEACDGQSALALAESHGKNIDLLLTDVIMPGMTGRELSRQLLEVRPEIKVLFMSGYTDNVLNEHGVMNHEYAFIEKPFAMTQLLDKVDEVINL